MNECALELRATPADVMHGVECLGRFCSERHLPCKTTYALMLALEEMASNIVNHACQCDATQRFHLVLRHSGNEVTVELRDSGPAFDPLQACKPDLEQHTDDRGIGGLGIHLVCHYMDDIRYTRVGSENVVRMTKRLQSP